MRNTKTVLASILMIGIVAMVAGAGTLAYFSDVETSSGNTFTAGTLDLKINDTDNDIVMFTVSNVTPGDSGSAEVILKNAGSVDGFLDINFSNIIDDDVSCIEPEQKVEGGDCGVSTDPGAGELADNLHILAYIDVDENGGHSVGDLDVYSGMAINIAGEQLSNYTLNFSVTKPFRIDWDVGSGVGNDIQSDKAGFDIEFELAQTEGQ